MVSTRHHPRPFPEPDLTPSRTLQSPTATSPSPAPASSSPIKRSASTKRKSMGSADVTATPTPASSSKALTRRSASTRQRTSYTHTPPPLLILWLLFSLPLVIWDTAYVLGRPHTMPGGTLHNYLWKPYALYGTVDHNYGLPGWNKNIGFVSAQAALNAIETVMYIYYLAVLGTRVATGDGFIKGVATKLNIFKRQASSGDKIVVHGEGVAVAVLVCFAATVMTFSKTIIYFFNEAFTGWEGIKHNSLATLFGLWIVPNGPWVFITAWMLAVLGTEIVEGLQHSRKSA